MQLQKPQPYRRQKQLEQLSRCRLSMTVALCRLKHNAESLRRREGAVMKATIMVTDTFVRFRLAAIEQSSRKPQTWEQQVMTIQQVASILVSLGFLDFEAAGRLTDASTTITPQQGLTTVPFADFVPLIESVHPEDEPHSPEAEEGYVLIAQGETTEEALAAAGFVLEVDGSLQ